MPRTRLFIAVFAVALVFALAARSFFSAPPAGVTTQRGRIERQMPQEEDAALPPRGSVSAAAVRPLGTLAAPVESNATLDDRDEEEDSDLVRNQDLAKPFVFGTPPPAAPQGPSMVVVGPTPEAPAAAEHLEESGDTEAAGPAANQALDALRELERLQHGASRIGGVRVRGAEQAAAASPTEVADETSADEALLKRVAGQVRGFVMLPLMQQQARESIEKQVETLIRAQVRDLYVGFLVDGTFGLDFEYASSVINRLAAEGRTLTLELYLSNGPTMRKWKATPIRTAFSTIDPLLFRGQIQYNQRTRAEFKKIVEAAKPLFMQNRNLGEGNRNLACIMLEDNLEVNSYRAMRSLASAELGGLAGFVRNPCPRCYDGNDTDAAGDALESHNPDDVSVLGSRDGLTLDGEGYNYPDESAGKGKLGWEQVKLLATSAASRKIGFFGLWRGDRQGVATGDQSVHPSARTYAVPTEAQVRADIELLRTGLAQ